MTQPKAKAQQNFCLLDRFLSVVSPCSVQFKMVSVCSEKKPHKYALHPVSQKSPQSCPLKQRYTNRGTGYGLHMDDMHNIYMVDVRCIHGWSTVCCWKRSGLLIDGWGTIDTLMNNVWWTYGWGAICITNRVWDAVYTWMRCGVLTEEEKCTCGWRGTVTYGSCTVYCWQNCHILLVVWQTVYIRTGCGVLMKEAKHSCGWGGTGYYRRACQSYSICVGMRYGVVWRRCIDGRRV